MLTAICRLLGLVQPCREACESAALGQMAHERLSIELAYRRNYGYAKWLEQFRDVEMMAARLACREERW